MADIRLEQLTKVYPDGTRAVSELDLEIADGEFIVLVGPSGCGKTSALRMVAGLEPITERRGKIGGRVVNDLPPKNRDIAMVFQNYALYPHMSAFKNMAFGLKLRKVPRPEIKTAGRRRGQGARPRGRAPEASAHALRRAAPAGRDGPRDRPRAAGVPDGRAALEPRREAARRDARRDRPAPARPRRHDDLRHARPGGGDHARRPRRRDAGRLPAADRLAAGALQPAGQPLRRRVHRLAGDEPRRRRPRQVERPPGRALRRARARRSTASSSRRGRRCPSSWAVAHPRHPPRGHGGRRGRRRRARGSPDRRSGRHPRGHGLGALRALRDRRPAGRGEDVKAALGEDAIEATGESARREGGLFVARVGRGSKAEEGGRIDLVVDPSRLHFFDPETSAAIY